ncbi:EAL domain-containing protein, partial [Agathobacter rectalis]|uniref:EAL domain-containing protein n=1 Tax=Agathobacter rectalis TaxID=39491 RepID=UPI0027EBB1F3|nr:EAL domain-containing protein [Agathobacter rectalis]
VLEKLNNLKAQGHVMMIDDFGMGHTSILYLQSSNFGVVKLDGSLVKDILTNTTNQQIVSSIVTLADRLHIKIIAEFVETAEQRDKLLELGCKWYQGYLYEKPVPLAEFIDFMEKHSL